MSEAKQQDYKIECILKRNGGTKVKFSGPEREYHFKPSDSDPRHVAVVDIETHAKQLLRIKEGYQLIEGPELAVERVNKNIPPVMPIKGSSVHSANYTILGGAVIGLDELVETAFNDSGLIEEEWNALTDQERYEFIDTTLKELQNGTSLHHETSATQKENDSQPSAEPVPHAPQNQQEDGTETDTAPQDDHVQDLDNQESHAADHTDDANNNGISDDLEALTRDQLIPVYQETFGRKPSSSMKVDDIRRAITQAKEED